MIKIDHNSILIRNNDHLKNKISLLRFNTFSTWLQKKKHVSPGKNVCSVPHYALKIQKKKLSPVAMFGGLMERLLNTVIILFLHFNFFLSSKNR